MKTMTDKQIVNAYFANPTVRQMLDRELGPPGKIKVDWEKRKIIARGSFSGREWNLDEFLKMLREAAP